jgi:hypothetical protein
MSVSKKRCKGLLADGEFGIDGYLESVGEGVGLGGHSDDGEKFGVLLVREPLGTGRGGVGVDTVAAVVDGGDSDVDELLVRGSRAPGAIMTCLMLAQVRSRRSGWLARARQKLLTKLDLRVARMSSKTDWRRGLAEISASASSFAVGMR